MPNFTSYKFRVDVYKKKDNTYYDDAGQAIEELEKDRTIRCIFMPSRGEERLVGRIQNPHSYMLWTDDLNVDYSDVLKNLRDRNGNIVEDMEFNVIGIKKFVGWSTIHHLEVNIQARLA